MGTDKAMTIVAGRTMLEWAFSALTQVVPDVVVVGREEARDLPALGDAMPGTRGPSAGIVTALGEAGGRPTLVVGVDQPWLRPATLRALLETRPLPAIPFALHYQVTCAVYGQGSLEVLTGVARKQGSLQTAVPHLGGTVITPERWRSWGEDGRSWFSVDTPGDLREGLRRYGPP